MNLRCETVRNFFSAYLDGELTPGKRARVKAHILECGECRKELERAQGLLELIRDRRNLPEAPAELRSDLERKLNAFPEAKAPRHLRDRIRQMVESRLHFSTPRKFGWLAIGIPAVVLAVFLSLWFSKSVPRESQEFGHVAVDTHMRRMGGKLPLEITSHSPDEVSAWFAGKVPFHLKLPNYEGMYGGETPYQLEGARLVGFRDDYAANVSYRMNGRLITLLVASDLVAEPWGQETVTSHNIDFYFQSYGGLKVITWKDRGLSYALVSDLEERGEQSCIVCHAESERRDFINDMK